VLAVDRDRAALAGYELQAPRAVLAGHVRRLAKDARGPAGLREDRLAYLAPARQERIRYADYGDLADLVKGRAEQRGVALAERAGERAAQRARHCPA